LIRNVFQFDLAPGIPLLPSVLGCRNGGNWLMRRSLACIAVLFALTLWAFLASSPGPALAAPPDGSQQGAEPSDKPAAKSEAAEAWDAVKNTTNPALLEAFIKRYGTSFFAEIAKARLSELKAAAATQQPSQRTPTDRSHQPALQMPTDGVREQAVLFEEDTSDPKGRQFTGSAVWQTELIKANGKPDELAARADVDIPTRGLRMRMLLRRNLDPSLPASHVIELTIAVSSDFDGGGVANVPGILMKSNLQARGTPLAGLAVKVTEGSFLVGLSSVAADRERNLKLLLERSWFDIPIVYANQRRAILAVDKGASGDQAFKTALTSWEEYPGVTPPAAAVPEYDGSAGNAR
jgi:hypothetical protein